MTKKPSGKFLFTWNDRKDPQITDFFKEIDEGLYSHTLREVIKSYMEQKNSPNHSNKSDQGQVKEKEEYSLSNNQVTDSNQNDGNYTNFDASSDLKNL